MYVLYLYLYKITSYFILGNISNPSSTHLVCTVHNILWVAFENINRRYSSTLLYSAVSNFCLFFDLRLVEKLLIVINSMLKNLKTVRRIPYS